jgi:hypothetical protein
MRSVTALSLLCVLALSACSNNETTADKGVNPGKEVSTPLPDTGTPVQLTCTGTNCKDFVLNKLIVPTNQADAQKYGFVLNSKTYNALGQVLALISQQVTSLKLQDSIDGAVNAGTTIVLLRLQAADWANEAKALAQSWIGTKATCCKTPDDRPSCATETLTTCFKGTFEFTPDTTSPSTLLAGKIASTALTLNAASMKLVLPITGAGTLDLTLNTVQVKGTVATGSPDKLTNGVLAGLISVSDIQNKLIPTVATMLTTTLQDSTTSAETKTQITTLFDTDKNGTVTKEELAANGLISTVLSGDVDIDGDKKPDYLSLGVGFEAVAAKIKDK